MTRRKSWRRLAEVRANWRRLARNPLNLLGGGCWRKFGGSRAFRRRFARKPLELRGEIWRRLAEVGGRVTPPYPPGAHGRAHALGRTHARARIHAREGGDR